MHVNNDTIFFGVGADKFLDLYQVSEGVCSQIMIVSQKSFNSYPGQPGCNGQWTERDFIVRFPGQSAAERELYIECHLVKVLEHS